MPAFSAPIPPLTDGEVTVRALSEDDVVPFWQGTRLPEVDQAWSKKLPDEGAARAYVHEFVPDRMAQGAAIVLAVADAATDRFLGIVMVFFADWDQRTVELGFWLHREARGRGAAAVAIRLMTDWVMREHGFERVWALTQLDNPGARRTLERAGFQHEGTLRGFERVDGRRRDLISLARLHTDA